jgi:hypothetical protein
MEEVLRLQAVPDEDPEVCGHNLTTSSMGSVCD